MFHSIVGTVLKSRFLFCDSEQVGASFGLSGAALLFDTLSASQSRFISYEVSVILDERVFCLAAEDHERIR